MIFADLELARRLERVEAVGGASFVEARQRLSPDVGAQWIDVCGTYAMFDGPDSPITQTFGLGLFAEPSADDLDRLEAFFQERGAPVSHEVSPLAGVPVVQMLSRRGYRPIEFTSVMFMPLGRPLPFTPKDAAAARCAGASHHERRGGSVVGGCRSTGGARAPSSERSSSGWAGSSPRATAPGRSLPTWAAQPVATGVLRCHEGVALFGGASTIPEARNRGAHRSLFEARMRVAIAEGCELAMICAQPGSTSQRNAERLGFRIAYTRIKWQRVSG